jgi:histidyl-tRNA synthetase
MESIMEMIRNRSIQIECPSVVVIPIGDKIAEALKISAELRNSGIRTRIDTSKRKIKKRLRLPRLKGFRM